MKNNESELMLVDIQNTQKMCQQLLQSPHYKKMGADGVFAIVEKARSVGVSPMDALNGGMYFVRGKVEMSASMMNQLIRMHKHSITKDKKSDDTVCILHGKRADNGDTWVESFSMEDAKRAGLMNNPTWKMYPKDMLFARALSRLARQLFPDLIKGCYVEGEISLAPPLTNEPKEIDIVEELPVSEEEYNELMALLSNNDTLLENIRKFLMSKYKIESLRAMPRDIYDLALKRAKEECGSVCQVAGEAQQMEA